MSVIMAVREGSAFARILIVLALFSILVSGGCGGGGGESAGGAGATGGGPPDFQGVALAYAPDSTSVSLHWPTAQDSETPSSEISYRIYFGLGNTVSSIKNTRHLSASVKNRTSHRLRGLTPGTTYHALVVAVDGDGNESTGRNLVEVSTPPGDLAAGTTIRHSADMAVTVTENSRDDFDLTGDDAGRVRAGDTLVVGGSPRGGMLKRVVSVSALPGGQGVNVTTADTSLGDIISSGSLRSTAVLMDVPGGSLKAGAKAAAGERARRYADPEGAFSLVEAWEDSSTGTEAEAAAADDFSNYDHSKYLTSDKRLRLGYTVGFSPTIETEADFDRTFFGNKLKSVKVVATGDLSLDALLGYYLSGNETYGKTVTLGQKSITLAYSAGPVPVYQDIGLKLMAEVNLTAGAKFDAEAKLSSSKKISIGVEYTKATDTWKVIRSSTSQQSVTFDITAQGDVVAQVKVYPIITTRFYKAASTDLHLEPSLNLNASANLIPRPELTRFDVDYSLDAHLTARLQVFDLTLADWQSGTYNLLKKPLFGLPAISVSCPSPTLAEQGSMTCAAQVTDGTQNPVKVQNITWSVDTKGGLGIASLGGAEAAATHQAQKTVTGLKPGKQTLRVTAWGQGFLGTLGATSATTTINVTGLNDIDNDGDGFTENQLDCDDSDPDRHPNQTWWWDADHDGYSEGTSTIRCMEPNADFFVARDLISTGGDCDDGDKLINPGILEDKSLCGNGIDEDCDGADLVCPGADNPPSAPGNFGIMATSTTSVSISWTHASDDKGLKAYELYRNGSLLATLSYPASTSSDSSLKKGNDYCYKVRAIDSASQAGPFSDEDCTVDVDPNTGDIRDKLHGLNWMPKDDGRLYNWYEASGDPSPFVNPGALDACTGRWNLPTKAELESIENRSYCPATKPHFRNIKYACYWTSDTNNASLTDAYYVNFGYSAGGSCYAYTGSADKLNQSCYVLCVQRF